MKIFLTTLVYAAVISTIWIIGAGFLRAYINICLKEGKQVWGEGGSDWFASPFLAWYVVAWPITIWGYPLVYGAIKLTHLPDVIARKVYTKKHMGELVQKELAGDVRSGDALDWGKPTFRVNLKTDNNTVRTTLHMKPGDTVVLGPTTLTNIREVQLEQI